MFCSVWFWLKLLFSSLQASVRTNNMVSVALGDEGVPLLFVIALNLSRSSPIFRTTEELKVSLNADDLLLLLLYVHLPATAPAGLTKHFPINPLCPTRLQIPWCADHL